MNPLLKQEDPNYPYALTNSWKIEHKTKEASHQEYKIDIFQPPYREILWLLCKIYREVNMNAIYHYNVWVNAQVSKHWARSTGDKYNQLVIQFITKNNIPSIQHI